MDMPERLRRTFNMYSRTGEHRARVEEALKVIDEALSWHERRYVAYSGGKDSICLLHLVLSRGDADIWHWDHGPYLMPRQVELELQAIGRRILAESGRRGVFIIETSRRLNTVKARWEYMRWYRSFYGRLRQYIEKYGWTLGFLGLRAEESPRRARRLRNRFFKHTGLITECYPLARWTWMDVWAYIVSHGLPYPSFYDRYAKVLGYDKTRLVTFFDREFSHLGAENIDNILMWRERNKK